MNYRGGMWEGGGGQDGEELGGEWDNCNSIINKYIKKIIIIYPSLVIVYEQKVFNIILDFTMLN